MVLDLLPYKSGSPWLKGKSAFRFVYFFAALAIVVALVFGFDYTMHRVDSPVDSVRALYWFIVGNAVYYVVAIVLAVVLKDNRAFCKYLCPASVFLKLGAVCTLTRIKGDADKCNACGTCSKACPMSIDIPSYIKDGQRVKSTECILCMKCIAVCPNAALKASAGFDLATSSRKIFR